MHWSMHRIGTAADSARVLSMGGKTSKIYTGPKCTNTCAKAGNGVCDEGRSSPKGQDAPPVSCALCTDCDDSRKHQAGNGVCDEGRSNPKGQDATQVFCDLGTDCDDCGAWDGHLANWPGGEPVAFITLKHNKTLKVKLTDTHPEYLMTITQWEIDPDVSAMVEKYGALEGGVTRVMYEILEGRCTTPGGQPAVVLDVGANLGYFALYAAKMGCRVIAWEPVELFRAYLAHGIAVNNLTHLVEVRSTAICDSKTSVRVGIPKDGTYWGLASVDNLNLQPSEVIKEIDVPAERSDTAIPPGTNVLLLKIDVEGYEPAVIRSAERLMAKSSIANILLEYSPGIPERSRNYEGMLELPLMLESLQKADFAIAHLPLRFATPWPPKTMPDHYRDPIPGLEEVTKRNIDLDIRAARMRMDGEKDGACPVPGPLQNFGTWKSCREWAYAAHPKGFRSSFGFNTNTWLTKKSLAKTSKTDPSGKVKYVDRMPLQSQASLFSEDQDMKVWQSLANSETSIGYMKCDNIGHGHKAIVEGNYQQRWLLHLPGYHHYFTPQHPTPASTKLQLGSLP
eukprot:gene25661-11326_t